MGSCFYQYASVYRCLFMIFKVLESFTDLIIKQDNPQLIPLEGPFSIWLERDETTILVRIPEYASAPIPKTEFENHFTDFTNGRFVITLMECNLTQQDWYDLGIAIVLGYKEVQGIEYFYLTANKTISDFSKDQQVALLLYMVMLGRSIFDRFFELTDKG